MTDLSNITPTTHPLSQDFTILDLTSHPLLIPIYEKAASVLPPNADLTGKCKAFFHDLLQLDLMGVDDIELSTHIFELPVTVLDCARRYINHWRDEEVQTLKAKADEMTEALRQGFERELERRGDSFTFLNLLRLHAETTLVVDFFHEVCPKKPSLEVMEKLMSGVEALKLFNLSPTYIHNAL